VTVGDAGSDTVAAMQAYYAQRAAIYERVYLKPERQAELRAMERWIAGPSAGFAGRRVLEVACGTGWWTPHAARDAADWLATDINPETMAIARAKPLPPCVRFAEADAYGFTGLEGQRFDAAFAGCWWSHVPLARLPGWLERLHERLEPGARVVFLDNSFVQTRSTPISRRDADGNGYQRRTLDDGSVHEVLKNFPTREEAFAAIGPRARDPQWIAHTHYWILSYTLA
jgi:demethylmenaquinone methyltransferase/2-methoxy-6-polyprenyl-1,4-benzoquinol methylase